jgi:DNA-binding LytR/AlgR family response regulator
LVKPVSESVLKEKVRSIIELQAADKPVYIEFKNKDGIDVVNIYTILFIESFSHDVVVHTAEGAKKYPKRMRDIEDRLYEHDFFRIHKSYVINLKKVTRISGENVILEGGAILPISRNRRKEFLIRFTQFMR